MTSPTTDEHNPLVSITEFADDGKLQIIHRYGGGGFSIAKQPYEGSQLVSMRKTTGWAVTHSDDITFESLKPLIETENPPELILFGLGETPTTHLPEIRTQLHALNIKMDVMSTAAACRTWNILLTEGRRAAAAILAID